MRRKTERKHERRKLHSVFLRSLNYIPLCRSKPRLAANMDDDEYNIYDDDSEQEEEADEEDDDDDFVDMQMDPETSNTERQEMNEEFQYTVLTPDELVKFMVDSIQEVNGVVQVCNMI